LIPNASVSPGVGGLTNTAAFVILLIGVLASAVAEDSQRPSQWDEDLPKIELHDVKLKPLTIRAAWQEMGTKYLLRANLYLDSDSISDTTEFSFQKERATGKEVFDAFVAAFPAYTYTRDPATGIIWLHPKRILYNTILPQKLRIERAEPQVLMLRNVYFPLIKLLSPSGNHVLILMERSSVGFNYPVDLTAGFYSARDILNICCAAEPTKAFSIQRDPGGLAAITPVSLYYGNPLAPPRDGLIGLWNLEVGESLTRAPSVEEIVSALSDCNPRKRWAARIYVKSTGNNYRESDIVAKCDNPIKAIWVALAFKCNSRGGIGDEPFLTRFEPYATLVQKFTNDLPHVDPGVALLASMELARELKDPGLMDVVAGHKFSNGEIACIKPDLYRIARESKLVRDKLLSMKFDAPELSGNALSGLEGTNVIELMSEEKK
jgi:hypothetical protein